MNRLGLILALARERGWGVPPPWDAGDERTTPSAVLGVLWDKLRPEDQEKFSLDLALAEADPERSQRLLGEIATPEEVTGETQRVAGGHRGNSVQEQPSAPGRYEVVREHARGGMGRVLVVVDHDVGREVALKELLPQHAHGLFWDRERFLREARITGQLEHPNIVPVYEIGAGEGGGAAYYTMKLVRGETMEERLARIQTDPLTGPRQKLAERLKLLDAFVDVCNAMAYAHARGVVNRDLKPSNVMLGDFGETVVLDWGLARKLGAKEEPPPAPRGAQFSPGAEGRTGDTTRLTMDGDVIGTPAYMSPEQARGLVEQVDEKSDVYALGVMLYEIATGAPPFEGATAVEILRAVIERPPPEAGMVSPDVPRELIAVALAALEKDRDKRLRSARELAEEVRAWRDGRPMTHYRHTTLEQVRRFARRNRALSAAVAAAAVILVAGALVSLTYAGIASERAKAEEKAGASEREARAIAVARTAEAERDRKAAQAALRLAQGQRMAAYSLNLLEDNVTAALLVAIEACRRAPGSASTNALWSSLVRLVERRRFIGHDHNVLEGCFSPDGTRIATAGADFTVRIWDVATGDEIRRLEGHRSGVAWVEWSGDGRTILTAPAYSADDRAKPYAPPGTLDVQPRLWDATTGACLKVLAGHTATLRDARLLPGGAVMSVSDDGTLRVWYPDGEVTVYRSPVTIHHASVSRDLRLVACVSEGDVLVWTREDPETPRRIHPSEGWLNSVDITSDGRSLLCSNRIGTAELYDAATLELLKRRPLSRTDAAGALSLAKNAAFGLIKDDGTAYAVHSDLGLHILTPDLSREISLCDFGWVPLDRRLFDRDWTRIAMLQDAAAWSRDLSTGRDSAILRGHEYKVEFARFSPDGRRMLTGGRDRNVILWDLEPGACLPTFRWHADREGAALSPDGTRVVVPAADTLELHDNRTGELLGTWKSPPDLFVLRFLGGSRRFLAWAREGETAQVVDTEENRILTVDAGGGIVHWVLSSPGGHHLLVENRDQRSRVWNLSTGEAGPVFPSPKRTYDFAALSHDGRRFAAVRASDASVAVHSTTDGSEQLVLSGHTGWTISTAFAHDGTVLTTAMDASVRSWDPVSGTQLRAGRWPLIIETFLRVPTTGDTVAVVTGEAARFYRLDTLEEIGALPRSTPGVADFTPDGRFAAIRRGSFVVHLPLDALAFAESVVPRELTPLENERMSDDRAASEAYARDYAARHPRPGSLLIRSDRALAAGRADEALSLASEAAALLPSHPGPWRAAALAYAARAAASPPGSARIEAVEAGIRSIENAVRLGDRDVAFLETSASLAPLRDHARWTEILAAARKAPWE
jgi:serine/threonine protein kinase/WD40 repeat protein